MNVALFVLVHRNLDVVFTVNAILVFLAGLIVGVCPRQLCQLQWSLLFMVWSSC